MHPVSTAGVLKLDESAFFAFDHLVKIGGAGKTESARLVDEDGTCGRMEPDKCRIESQERLAPGRLVLGDLASRRRARELMITRRLLLCNEFAVGGERRFAR